MFHFILFNFCTYVQTWMSIFTKLILKYRSSVQINKENVQWWYLNAVASSFWVSNSKCRISYKLMISLRHSTSFLFIKTSLSLYVISHYLIHILKVFFGFYCFIFLILSLQIYCFETTMIEFVATLALGSRPKQGFARVQAKREARESHLMLPGVWESVRE
jgi:hypothetical protein